MKIKTQLKAGKIHWNHNESLIRSQAKGLKVKTQLKAGALSVNHNPTLVSLKARGFHITTRERRLSATIQSQAQPAATGLKVKSQVKAGGSAQYYAISMANTQVSSY